MPALPALYRTPQPLWYWWIVPQKHLLDAQGLLYRRPPHLAARICRGVPNSGLKTAQLEPLRGSAQTTLWPSSSPFVGRPKNMSLRYDGHNRAMLLSLYPCSAYWQSLLEGVPRLRKWLEKQGQVKVSTEPLSTVKVCKRLCQHLQKAVEELGPTRVLADPLEPLTKPPNRSQEKWTDCGQPLRAIQRSGPLPQEPWRRLP